MGRIVNADVLRVGSVDFNLPTADGSADQVLKTDGSKNLGWVTPSGATVCSTAEAQAGTENTKMITPLRMREGFNAGGSAPVYACRAWVSFNGTGTVAINASGNVSSITDNGTGDYTVNFSTAMSDANYSSVYSLSPQFETRANWPHVNAAGASVTEEAPTTTYFRIGSLASTKADTKYNHVAVYR